MSNLTFDEFLQRFVDELNISFDDVVGKKLSEIPEYDSMGKNKYKPSNRRAF